MGGCKLRAVVRAFALTLALAMAMATGSQAAGRLLQCTQQGPKRVALVVGNWAYPDGALPRAQRDAAEIAAKMCSFGFAYVHLLENADKQTTLNALGALRRQVTADTNLSLFYYSGHGVSVAGVTFIVPINVSPNASADAIKNWGVSVDDTVVTDLGAPDYKRVRIIIFDGCRDDAARNGRMPSMLPDISETPNGTLNLEWVFAVAPRRESTIVVDNHSLFSWSLLEVLGTSASSETDDVHKLAVNAAIEWQRAQNRPQLEIPDRHGTPTDHFFYVAPPAVAANVLKQPTVVDAITDQVWSASTPKGPTVRLVTGRESVAELLARAQQALKRQLHDAAGKRRFSEYGFPMMAPDFFAAKAYWEAAAKLGSVSAKRRLAELYLTGHGVKQDQKLACSMFAETAKANDRYGTDRLGDCYRDGVGVSRDDAKAIALYKKAISRGLEAANADLAWMHYRGRVPGTKGPDYAGALELFKKAAKAGDTDAATWVGFMYLTDRPKRRTPELERAAYAHFIRAEQGHNVRAMEYLSRLFRKGYVVKKNERYADMYFDEALAYVDDWYVKKVNLDQD